MAYRAYAPYALRLTQKEKEEPVSRSLPCCYLLPDMRAFIANATFSSSER